MPRLPWNAQLLFEAVPATAVAPASSRPRCAKHPLGNVHVKVSMYRAYCMIEGSLEVKFPTIWTDGKVEVRRVRQEKEERRSEKGRRQKTPAIKKLHSVVARSTFVVKKCQKGKNSQFTSTSGAFFEVQVSKNRGFDPAAPVLCTGRRWERTRRCLPPGYGMGVQRCPIRRWRDRFTGILPLKKGNQWNIKVIELGFDGIFKTKHYHLGSFGCVWESDTQNWNCRSSCFHSFPMEIAIWGPQNAGIPMDTYCHHPINETRSRIWRMDKEGT